MNVELLIVDDHPMLRNGLRDALARHPGFTIVGEASTGADAVKKTQELKPDLVVMDVVLPDISGIVATRQILEVSAGTKVIIFSSQLSRAFVDEALQAGACGYVPKSSEVEELIHATELVMSGKLYLSPQACGDILADYRRDLIDGRNHAKPFHSERERRLLQLVSKGCRNKEIASEMGISTKSIETYRARLMKKVNCTNTAELVRYAIREGIAAP